MRIAALYDVHGNLPALEAVLAELDRDRPDAIVCGGDLVWGPEPVECLRLLRDRDARFLAGNCERAVLERRSAADAWCDDRLDREARAYIRCWPATVSLDGVLFCHGSPRSDDEILTVRTPDAAAQEALADVTEATIVCGHTHHQFDRRVGDRRLVNAGSVGLPYEGRAAAFWASLGPEPQLRRTDYDVEAAVSRLRRSDFPGVDGLLHPSLVEPVSRDEAVEHFERRAGRAA